ncbi:serine protease [uncultured Roseobacter sp.]|uniref:serine protease n=1 Tax=uncultured Roseobacter sp. TaxID=114847 RepID=UPI0026072F79|nr:serine protease [uncultured Roseobacter sp.]
MFRVMMVCLAVFVSTAQGVRAQSEGEVVWIQIEAQPNLQDGISRAQDYARALADVNGFSLGGGWYGIVLGPYTPGDADQVLSTYLADRLIPRDSYITETALLRQQFFPLGADLTGRGSLTAAQAPQPAAEATEPQTPAADAAELDASEQSPPAAPVVAADPAEQPALPPETLSEARRGERALTAAERRGLQIALEWAGFYNASIDGAFGRGTRAAMTAWQQANGHTETGVLTTAQRAELLGQYNAVLEGLDLRRVTDSAAGIQIDLPTAQVSFDRYEPPFAQYNATDDGPAQVLLISQPGGRDTLASLYEVMQTLEIVPLQGARTLDRNSFSLIGRNDEIVSETRVSLEDGALKGFTLVWPAGDDAQRERLISQMQASFTRLPGVLDPATGTRSDQGVDLLAGLQIRQPKLSRSGFYVDAQGAVVTTADAVQSCSLITLDDTYPAEISALDSDLGVAVLQPSDRLAPPEVARFSPAPPRLKADVAAAGYSYEGVLNAATITFGTLSDIGGLGGEPDLKRLSLNTLPGDAGGPVFDTSGHVLGMLLPLREGDRGLPPDVRFARAGPAIARTLQQAGLSAASASGGQALDPEDIATRARNMTVLVSCWE